MTLPRIVLRSFVQMALPLLAGGCGMFGGDEKPPPPPNPTLVELAIESAQDVNPRSDGTSSPVLVRVYELSEPVKFKNADFFALYDKDDATLGGDMLRKREFTLSPGTSRSMQFKAEDDTRFAGIFAAFRKLDTANWRALTQIPPNRTTAIVVRLSGTQISLESMQKPEPKPEESD